MTDRLTEAELDRLSSAVFSALCRDPNLMMLDQANFRRLYDRLVVQALSTSVTEREALDPIIGGLITDVRTQVYWNDEQIAKDLVALKDMAINAILEQARASSVPAMESELLPRFGDDVKAKYEPTPILSAQEEPS